MNYLDPEYQEFLRRQILGQVEPVMLDPSLVPPEQVAVSAVAPMAKVEPEPKPMTELEQIQARIGQASAQTQDAAKQYQDWLAGLGGRFRSDMEGQTAALKKDSEMAYRQRRLNESLGSALSILGLKDAAQPYQQMAVQAAQIQGQAPQKQQQLFSDYLQKVAGLEGRGLESKMEMAGRLEQGARGELTKYQDRLSQEMRHAQSMLMAAKTAEEQRKWQEEMKRLEIASREANAAAERQVHISEGALNRENQLAIAGMRGGAAGDKLDNKQEAINSMFPDPEYRLKNPASAAYMTPGQLTEIQNAHKIKNDIGGQISRLIAKAKEFGREWLGTEKAAGDSDYKGLILSLKEAENLGVLQKLDIDALEELVPNPLTPKPLSRHTVGTDIAKLGAALERVKRGYHAFMESRSFIKNARQEGVAGEKKTAAQARAAGMSEQDIKMLIKSGDILP